MEQKETLEAVETKEVTAESVDFQFETVLNLSLIHISRGRGIRVL